MLQLMSEVDVVLGIPNATVGVRSGSGPGDPQTLQLLLDIRVALGRPNAGGNIRSESGPGDSSLPFCLSMRPRLALEGLERGRGARRGGHGVCSGSCPLLPVLTL